MISVLRSHGFEVATRPEEGVVVGRRPTEAPA
jgi:hypothetical protein